MGKTKKDWSILSQYRNEIYGLAIIGIIILHYFCGVSRAGITDLRRVAASTYNDIIGSTGVEIFLFLSGMGLFFSMSKNPNILTFYTRRIKRVLLAYVLWGGGFWFLRDIVLLKRGWERFFYDFTFMSFWKEGVTSLWYIAFIVCMYLVYPLIHKCIKKENKFRNLMFVLLLAISYLMINTIQLYMPQFMTCAGLAIYRVPVFICGAYYGNKIYEKKPFDKADFLLVMAGLGSNLLLIISRTHYIPGIKYISPYYIKCIYSIALVIITAWILSSVKKTVINKILAIAGALSLELYMTHVNIGNLMGVIGFKMSETYSYVLCVVMSVIMSFILYQACKIIIDKHTKRTIARKERKIAKKEEMAA